MTLQDTNRHTQAIADAIQQREKYYFGLAGRFDYVKLPTPQVCGTMTQQRSYAVDKAQQILEEYKTL